VAGARRGGTAGVGALDSARVVDGGREGRGARRGVGGEVIEAKGRVPGSEATASRSRVGARRGMRTGGGVIARPARRRVSEMGGQHTEGAAPSFRVGVPCAGDAVRAGVGRWGEMSGLATATATRCARGWVSLDGCQSRAGRGFARKRSGKLV